MVAGVGKAAAIRPVAQWRKIPSEANFLRLWPLVSCDGFMRRGRVNVRDCGEGVVPWNPSGEAPSISGGGRQMRKGVKFWRAKRTEKYYGPN